MVSNEVKYYLSVSKDMNGARLASAVNVCNMFLGTKPTYWANYMPDGPPLLAVADIMIIFTNSFGGAIGSQCKREFKFAVANDIPIMFLYQSAIGGWSFHRCLLHINQVVVSTNDFGISLTKYAFTFNIGRTNEETIFFKCLNKNIMYNYGLYFKRHTLGLAKFDEISINIFKDAIRGKNEINVPKRSRSKVIPVLLDVRLLLV
jgi:hypothetical protein